MWCFKDIILVYLLFRCEESINIRSELNFTYSNAKHITIMIVFNHLYAIWRLHTMSLKNRYRKLNESKPKRKLRDAFINDLRNLSSSELYRWCAMLTNTLSEYQLSKLLMSVEDTSGLEPDEFPETIDALDLDSLDY